MKLTSLSFLLSNNYTKNIKFQWNLDFSISSIFGAQSIKNVYGFITYNGIEENFPNFGHASFKGYDI
jgi:hypothetical protein